MEPKHLGALLLVIFGGYFLLNNLGFMFHGNVFWPIVLIILGLVALYQASSRPRRKVENGNVIYEINGSSSFLKGLVAIPVFFIVLILGLIMLGILGPFFIVSLAFIPLLLFFKLGWAFLRLLLPIVFGAAPLLILLWILLLIF